jgi:hypothetical protein
MIWLESSGDASLVVVATKIVIECVEFSLPLSPMPPLPFSGLASTVFQ